MKREYRYRWRITVEGLADTDRRDEALGSVPE